MKVIKLILLETRLMEPNGYRKRRKDYVHQQNGDLSTSSIDDELDPWTAWAYRPHTITLLLIGACFLIWASGALDPENSSSGDLVTSVKRGIWAMIAVFLAYCLLQAPSTLLIRPHPAFWRLVHGMAVVYLVALTFLLFQNRDDTRQFMKYLHPDLGVELSERSYGTDCRIYMPENPTSRFKNVYETLFDEFVPAHIFGWWGKAIMIRNQPLLWLLSIGFELMEAIEHGDIPGDFLDDIPCKYINGAILCELAREMVISPGNSRQRLTAVTRKAAPSEKKLQWQQRG